MSAHRVSQELHSAMKSAVRIGDPGDSGTITNIPNVGVQVCRLVSTSGSEARSVAAPVGLDIGDRLILCYAVDGGTQITVTFADDIDSSDNGSIVFATAGGWAEMIVMEVGDGVYHWRLHSNDESTAA